MLDFKKLWSEAFSFEEFVDAAKQSTAGCGRESISCPHSRLGRCGSCRRRRSQASGDCGRLVRGCIEHRPCRGEAGGPGPRPRAAGILRDANPEVMDQYLTNGSRSIPIVIALDEDFQEMGHWGPRPTELQAWVMANRGTMPKAELYPQVRKWYARDRERRLFGRCSEAAGLSVAKAA